MLAGSFGLIMIRERLEQELATNSQLRQYIRKLAKCPGKPYPIILVDGDTAPNKLGRSGYRVGWRESTRMWWHGRTGYWAKSTKRIEVGSDWLLEELFQRNYLKVKHGEKKENRTA